MSEDQPSHRAPTQRGFCGRGLHAKAASLPTPSADRVLAVNASDKRIVTSSQQKGRRKKV